jgi:hypothetical protein
VRRRVLLLVLFGLAGCGDRRDGGGSASAREAVADEAEAEEVAPPPPARPFRTLDAARLDELAAVEVPGFSVVHRDRSATSLVISLRAIDAPVRALVTITPCLACRPPDLDAWRGAAPELRALLPGAVEDDPATTFELTAVDLAGRRCIASHELGAIAYGDELEATHGARLYCNDGVTELVIRVDDDAILAAATPDAARQGAQRAAVEEPARRLAAAFLAAL